MKKKIFIMMVLLVSIGCCVGGPLAAIGGRSSQIEDAEISPWVGTSYRILETDVSQYGRFVTLEMSVRFYRGDQCVIALTVIKLNVTTGDKIYFNDIQSTTRRKK